MKKTFTILLFSFLAFSCKSNQSTKLDLKSEVALKGEWTINSISYPGSEYIKVNSFDIADSKCFVGSKWNFISNNNSGQMAIVKPECNSFESKIKWFINKENNIVLKFLNGEKAKNVTEGYILKISNQTETSFQLIDKIQIGGKSTEITYQFKKNN